MARRLSLYKTAGAAVPEAVVLAAPAQIPALARLAGTHLASLAYFQALAAVVAWVMVLAARAAQALSLLNGNGRGGAAPRERAECNYLAASPRRTLGAGPTSDRNS